MTTRKISKLHKKNRPFCVILMMLLTMTAQTAWATITGSGSETDPYVINTEDDWNTAATNNSYWYNGVYVELGSDLNFSGKTFNMYGGMLPTTI